MKKSIACISLFIGICSSAQDNFYVGKMDDIFFNLDKSAITSGILYDRTYPFSELNSYNSATDTSESARLEQSYFELYNAAYSKSAFLLPSDFADIVDIEKLKARTPIAIIDYNMHYIRPTAISENLIYYSNEHLYDVPGRPYPPYNLARIQMASPMTDSAHTGWVRFSLPDLLILTNNNVTVQSVTLSFSQGIITLSQNALDSIYFSTTGRQTGTITVNYTNGQYFSQKTAFYTTNSSGGTDMPSGRMMAPPPENDPCYSEAVQSNIAFQGYDESQPYSGWNTVNYYYRTNGGFDCAVKQKRSLGKPVIVLDGFDPTNKRFALDIKREAFFFKYPNGTNGDVADNLRSQGYDIVIVNHPDYIEGTRVIQTPLGQLTIDRLVHGGGDYIERNAMVLVKIIQDINAQLAAQGSIEKIIIVGPSMGGQISRVALKYMEDHGMNHNCRLWISMDSPHEGAILPIGLQGLAKALSGLFYKADYSLRVQINCSAAKQMTIHHHLANSETPAGAPGFFSRYYDYVNGPAGLGFPHNLRKIAGNSGARNGLVQNGFSCIPALRIYSSSNNLLVKIANFFGQPTYSESNVSLSPSQPQVRCQTASVKLLYLGSAEINFSQYASYNSSLYVASLEMLPGGYYPGFKEIVDSLKSTSQAVFNSHFDYLAWKRRIKGKYPDVTLIFGNHAHELTGSTLGFGLGPTPNPTRKWDDNVAAIDLVCTGEIPFDSYFGPIDFNTRHDSLFYEQALWFQDEITGTQRSPNLGASPVYPIQLYSGYEPICTVPATYKVIGTPGTATVTWSTTSSNISLNPIIGTQTTVTRISNGTAFLTATVANPCSPVTATTANIRVGGYGTDDYPVSGPSTAGCGYYVTYSTNQLPGATNYSWFYPGNWTYISGQGTYTLTLLTPNSSTSGYYQVGVRVANACDPGGAYAIKGTFFTGCYGYFAYSVSPNPATSDVTVMPDASASSSQTTITEVNIYDDQGNLKKRQLFDNVSKAVLNVSNLRIGIYFIEIKNGTYSERQKLSVVK